MDKRNYLCFDQKNLASLSMIRLSAFLWDNATIKKEIESLAIKISEERGLRNSPKLTAMWWETTEKILSHLELFNLPHVLSSELRRITILMGQQILHWVLNVLNHVRANDLIFDVKYFQKIYWTPDCLIDQLKIFQYWREEHPNFPGFPDNHRNKLALYYLGCFYWDEEYIEDSLREIGEIIDVSFEIKETNSVEDVLFILVQCHLLSNWKHTLSLPKKTSLMSSHIIRFFNNELKSDLARDFFHDSEGLIKYFYERMNPAKREQYLDSSISSLSTPMRAKLDSGPDKERDYHNRARVLLSLLKIFPKELMKDCLLNKICGIMKVFLTTWPYQNLCIPILNYVGNELPLSKRIEILEGIVKTLNRFPSKHKDAYRIVQQQVLKYLLVRIPGDEKLNFFVKNHNGKIYTLFRTSNYSAMNLIVNDDYLKKYRHQILDITRRMPPYFGAKQGKLKHLKEYLKMLDFSHEEEEKFFSNDLLVELILYDHFDIADEILKWRCDSNEEKIIARKKKIPAQVVFLTLFLYRKYDIIDKYAVWQCDGNITEAGNLNTTLLTNDFMLETFWSIWVKRCKHEFESVTKQFGKLLKYFLKTEEEVDSFKKKEIVRNECFVKTLCDVCLMLQNYKFLQSGEFSYDVESSCWLNLTKIFEFCSVSDNKVQEIKQKIKDDFDSWYRLYNKDMKGFLVLNDLVKWISDSNEEREIIIKKYLDPDVTARYLYSTFIKGETEVDAFSKAGETVFLRDWVSKYGDVNKIKERVRNIDNITENDVLVLTEMLNRFPHN